MLQQPITQTYWLVIIMAIKNEHQTTLTEKIEWRKTLWMFGFVKTTISTSLISTGVVLLFNGITSHPLFTGFNEIAIIVGFLMILGAVVTIITIDRYKEKNRTWNYWKTYWWKSEIHSRRKNFRVHEKIRKLNWHNISKYSET